MNFTTTPPTTPGFYAWRRNENDTPEALTIVAFGKDLESPTYDANVKYMGGQWCRLVPAEEVEKAYREASSYFNGAKSDCSSQHAWQDSRAKQVAEGNV